jgi:hypothetical protein
MGQCRWPLLSRSSGQALPRQRCRPRTSPVPTNSRAIRFGSPSLRRAHPPPSQPGSRPDRDRPLPYQSCRPGAGAPPVPDVRRSWYMSSARRGSGPYRRAVGRPLRPSTRAQRGTPAHPALGGAVRDAVITAPGRELFAIPASGTWVTLGVGHRPDEVEAMEPQRSIERHGATSVQGGTAADAGRALAGLYGDGEETAQPEQARPRVHGRPRPARSRRTTRSSS